MVTLARRVEQLPFTPVVSAMFAAVVAVLVIAVPPAVFGLGWPLQLMAAVAAAGVTAVAMRPLTAWVEQRFALARVARTPWRDEGYPFADETERPQLKLARPPILAVRELGVPLMTVEPEGAAVAQAAPVLEPESSEASPGEAGRAYDTTIAALIRRLEDGLAQRSSVTRANPAAPLVLREDWIVPASRGGQASASA